MATALSLNPARTALLAMDCQRGIVSAYVEHADAFLARASAALAAARRAGLLVVHVRVGFRPGLPEISDRNRLFGAIRRSAEHPRLFEGDAGEVHPALGPEPGDVVVTKHRVSAFAGTDLEQILRAREIDTLVLFGIATSGVVLSTLLEASDRDYRLAVLTDCCADRNAALHAALMDHLFPARADLFPADDFVRSCS